MTVHVLNPAGSRTRLRSAGDLVAALGIAFSDQQLAAITAPLAPGVVVAGAGSGKTTVMAARVVWLVGTGAVRPEEVLGLTFTRKAAAELSARIRSALLQAGVVADRGVDESGEQLVMTYDAFAARLVAEHGLRLGFEADPTMISGATRYRLASRVVRNAAGPFDFISRLRPATVTERVLKLDADLQQHLVPPEALDRHARDLLLGWHSAPLNNRGNVYADVRRAVLAAEERLELASLVRDYQALKRHLGVVEFADQMAIAARLAGEVPQVSTALRAAFRIVLLDEYQDTSAAQARMLRGLFSGASAPEGMGHPVTAVGDPFQAIYGWRGAAVSNILTFGEDFPQPGGAPARSYALTVNRRSGPEILAVANILSQPLRAESASTLADSVRRRRVARAGGARAAPRTGAGATGGRTGGHLRHLAAGDRLDRGTDRPCAGRRNRHPLGGRRGADPPQRRHRPALHRPDGARHPGGDRRPRRVAAPAGGARRDRGADAGRRRDRQPRADPAAHRPPLADRPPRPRPARATSPRAGP